MDKYLLKVGIDLDEAQLSAVTGAISDQLVEMGKVSDDFIDKALQKAKEYHKEIEKQEKIIKDIDKKLSGGGLDVDTQKLLEVTRGKAEDKLRDLQYGNAEKGIDSVKVVDSIAEYAKQAGGASHMMGKLTKAGSTAISKVSAFAAGLGTAKEVLFKFIGELDEAVLKLANYSNQLNPMGAFGSQSQRDLMSRYGMSGFEALGFKNVLDAMGMSEQDIGKMTEQQRKVFNSLTDFWNESIGKLDPDALERYTENLSKYQEMRAKYDMGLQLTILKLVSNSPKFERLLGKLGDFFDSTLDFLGSPLVQTVFDGLIDFLTTVVGILEKAMKLISAISGGSNNSTTIVNNNGNTTSNSTYNVYGTDFHSNDELARQISYSSKGGYRG